MAHKKAGGSTRNGRESNSKRLGVKKFGGEAGARRQHPGPPARHRLCAPATTSASGTDHTLLRQGPRPGEVPQAGRRAADFREHRRRIIPARLSVVIERAPAHRRGSFFRVPAYPN